MTARPQHYPFPGCAALPMRSLRPWVSLRRCSRAFLRYGLQKSAISGRRKMKEVSRMTTEQKTRIANMRGAGMSLADIAADLGLSKNTVKSYCRRNDVSGTTPDEHRCLCCGKPVEQTPGRKQKKFCSDICRARYWSAHPVGGAVYDYTCPACGRAFSAYGNQHRKYCSHACYIHARFGGRA